MKRNLNGSDKAAYSLRITDFGSADQIKAIAHMDRKPETYSQVREILSSLVGYSLVSRSDLHATISKKSIEKILSGRSIEDSHDFKAHLFAAGNIDRLYGNSIEPWTFEMNSNKNNDGLVGIHRLFALMEYAENMIIVKITVKEMKNPNDGNRIYTIKTLNVFSEEQKIEDAVS